MADCLTAAVVLDWRHATIGPLAPCVLCGRPALCRSPVKGTPCHKQCAEHWITTHARDEADRARLIRSYTPKLTIKRQGGWPS